MAKEPTKPSGKRSARGSGTAVDPIIPDDDDILKKWDVLNVFGGKVKNKTVTAESGSADETDEHVVKSFRLPMAPAKQSADVYRAYAGGPSDQGEEEARGTWGPTILSKVSATIPFVPKFTFFLGSPLGLFLTLRGARPIFDELRKKQEGEHPQDSCGGDDMPFQQPTSPFRLPSRAVYNIFHPSDPVAYRIEPLLLPVDFDESQLPPPNFLVLEGKDVRFHVKARELGGTLAKQLSGFFKNNVVKDSILTMSSNDSTNDTNDGSQMKHRREKGPVSYKFALGGKSDRVDMQLQTGLVENEYVSSVSAHASYWSNEDVLDFLIQCANE